MTDYTAEMATVRLHLLDAEDALDTWRLGRIEDPLPHIDAAGREAIARVSALAEAVEAVRASLVEQVSAYHQALAQQTALRQARRDVHELVW